MSMDIIKELRERTGAGMLDCKKAIDECGGSIEKAIDYLRTKGLAKAAKKADRAATEGMVACAVSSDHKKAAIMELNCETDFVAKNEKFTAFAEKLVRHILKTEQNDIEAVKNSTMDGKKVADLITEQVAVIGENMSLRRVGFYNDPEGFFSSYIHQGGAVGTLVDIRSKGVSEDTLNEIGRGVAMHVAASAPRYLDRSTVVAADLEREKEVLREQTLAEGKPANIVDKIVMGKIGKFYEENCLVDQEFVRDPDFKVGEYVTKAAKDAGGQAQIAKYVYFKKGEGLEKKTENFADEVAKMKG